MAGEPTPLRVVLGEWQHDEGFRRAISTPATLIPAPTLQDGDVAPLLHGADAFLSKRFTSGMAKTADRLRLILTPGAGTNQIDFSAVPDGVTVCNVHGHESAIAEYAFMAILALNRDLLNMDARFRRIDWSDRTERGAQREIRGRTLGIVGLGRIGGEVARIGQAFRMRVQA
ncbi:MAG TPA: NAD(P)-dependent oxidoreductase, partial [Thermomicrobiales bacterium]|nr:NAD(P)-dependent oxidoreductase [Thermomicrobiales bacterium]